MSKSKGLPLGELNERLGEIAEAYTHLGDFAAAIQIRQAELHVALQGKPDAHTLRLKLNTLGHLHQEAGHPAVAIPVFEEALRHLARAKLGDAEAEATIRSNLGLVCLEINDIDEAVRHLSSSISRCAAHRWLRGKVPLPAVIIE
jgi:tetratricopeptide (TPR) repeat protein